MIKILAIDDTVDILTALNLLIEQYMSDKAISPSDYSIKLQNNSEEAIETLDTFKPDLIFLDIMMPEISGFDLLQYIRNNPNIDPQPIVVISTALGDNKTKAKEQQLKANAYMIKPFDYKTISIILNRYLPLNQNINIDMLDFEI